MRQLVRSICSVCGLAVLLSGWATQPAAAVVSSASTRPFLLGTVEFRGVPLGGWYDFPDKVAEALDLFSRCARSMASCPKSEIVAVLAETANLPEHGPHQMLAAVNRLVNRHPHRSDLANFNASEHWASPLQFLDHSGDCEDFAIFKYALLRHLGLPADALRVVLLKRKADGLGHAVLAAYLDNKIYILDNVGGLVRPQSEVKNYAALFSFNENSRWAHIASSPEAIAPPNPWAPDSASNHRGPGLHDVKLKLPESADSALFMELYTEVFSSSRPRPNEYRVQLGAFRSLENADLLWQRVWRAQWDLLGQAIPKIHSLDAGGTGQLHLLQIGAMASARKAEALCADLMERGVNCFVVRPTDQTATNGQT